MLHRAALHGALFLVVFFIYTPALKPLAHKGFRPPKRKTLDQSGSPACAALFLFQEKEEFLVRFAAFHKIVAGLFGEGGEITH